MSTTPEGRVKQQIKLGLNQLGSACMYSMPVPTGYGSRSCDFVGCFKGRYFAIEVKRADGRSKVTKFQEMFLNKVADAGGIALIARCWDDVKAAFEYAGLLPDA